MRLSLNFNCPCVQKFVVFKRDRLNVNVEFQIADRFFPENILKKLISRSLKENRYSFKENK